MYVAVKGGERAIDAAHDWLADKRRGPADQPAIHTDAIRDQLSLAIARVMAEGSLYDPDLAALAIKQARGDLIEAVFLIRAYRTTLPRLGASRPIDTGRMAVARRISATFKDAPGGQLLGPTFDYTHRLLDFRLMADGELPPAAPPEAAPDDRPVPHILSFLNRDGMIEPEHPSEDEPADLTRTPLELPADRALRLQALARGDEGFLLGLAYSTQRGYARNHAFVGELRIGTVAVEMEIPELGFAIEIGEIELTECETVNQFKGSKTEPAQFTRGYGLTFGQTERKALSMALVDRALRWQELGEDFAGAPAQDQEFVLSHCDNIQATGFLEHIKLPHYVDFQSELELVRRLRAAAAAPRNIVFDIGNVLVRWNLHAAFAQDFDSPEAIDAYLEQIGFHDWNRRQDGGRPWAEGIAELHARHGDRAHPAVEYPARHALTIAEPIAGTWAILDRLAARGHALYAITNWSSECWPDAQRLHPRLEQVFRDIVVSGREGLLKPDAAIFRILCDRNGLDPATCLFIDDSAANAAGARAFGMDAVTFTTPEALETELTARGLL